MKILYFDCFAGASGNMILGALVALGVDKNKLVEELRKLDISDFEIEFTTKDKSGISALHADVKVPHEHAHRHLHHIEKIINDSRLSEKIKARAVKIFTKLAEAEAKIHGIDVQKVHFHEVGAMDAIVDVVGACIGFEMLGIEKFVCSKIHVGSGFAQMAHGKFPIPPPAVAELLQNAPIYSTEIEGELITPTGAAIISTACDSYGQIPEMTVEKSAYGAGTREYKDFPNVLRLILGNTEEIGTNKFEIDQNTHQEEKKHHSIIQKHATFNKKRSIVEEKHHTDGKKHNADAQKQSLIAEKHDTDDKKQSSAAQKQSADAEKQALIKEKHDTEEQKHIKTESLMLIETNLDDISAEILGYVMEKAFEIGALDCWFTPIQMKKNRPAAMISILCDADKANSLKDLLFTETTTLGIRQSKIERECLAREIVKVETEFGEVDVKVSKKDGKTINAKPEYEQIRQIALQSKKSFREIEREILENLQAETRA